MVQRISLVGMFAAFVTLGCGSDGGPTSTGNPLPTPKDFGQYPLATTQEMCEAVAGLSGDTILTQKVDHIETVLDYITPKGERVNPTPVTIDLTWPTKIDVVCYPPYEQPGLNPALARVAIPGLEMKFVTADGQFNEIIDAKAWLIPFNGTVGQPMVIGTSNVEALQGTFKPPPEIIPNPNLMFTTRLDAVMPNAAMGAIGMTTENPEDINAGILIGSIAAALWPSL